MIRLFLAQVAPEATLQPTPWLSYVALGLDGALLVGLVLLAFRVQTRSRPDSSSPFPAALSDRLKQQEDLLALQSRQVRELSGRVQSLEDRLRQAPSPSPPAPPPPFPRLAASQLSSPAPSPGVATGGRADSYNRILRLGNDTVIKERLAQEWPAMQRMSLDLEHYRAWGDIYLYPSATGVFYALPGDSQQFEVFFDPGFSVENEAVRVSFDVSGSGSYIESMVEPAVFVAEGRGGRLTLQHKGRLIAS